MRANAKIPIYVALIGAGAVVVAAFIGYCSRGGNTIDVQPKAIQYTGRVTDANNNKIPNAKVFVETDKNVQVQMTDSEGYFKVTVSEAAKSVRLKVEKDNYEPFDRTVSLDRTGVEPIQLSSRPSATPSPSPAEKLINSGRKSSSTDSQSRKRRHDAAINALIGNRP